MFTTRSKIVYSTCKRTLNFPRLITTQQARWKVSSIRPATALLHDMDETKLVPKFQGFSELENADPRVRRLFTVEYGRTKDVYDEKINQLVGEVQATANEDHDLIAKVVWLTVMIKRMQEKYAIAPNRNKPLRRIILEKSEERRVVLEILRDHQFETYAKLMTVLDLKHRFDPEHEIGKSPLSNTISDMRIRSFAESRRLIATQKKRKQRLDELKLKIKERFESEL